MGEINKGSPIMAPLIGLENPVGLPTVNGLSVVSIGAGDFDIFVMVNADGGNRRNLTNSDLRTDEMIPHGPLRVSALLLLPLTMGKTGTSM